MKQRIGRIVILGTVLLALTAIVLSREWPLPTWASTLLKNKLASQSIDLKYQAAFFDARGNVRLEKVSGHYQGLLEFSASQVLGSVSWTGDIRVTVDAGLLHTGFMQLPLPETIKFAGTVEQEKDRLIFRNFRLRANSLVALIHGELPLAQLAKLMPADEKKPALAIAKGSDYEVIAGLLAELCKSKTLWVAEVKVDPAGSLMTLAGDQLDFKDIQIRNPSLEFSFPVFVLGVQADEISAPWGRLLGASSIYQQQNGNLWNLFARSAQTPKVTTGAIGASLKLPLQKISDLAQAKDISANIVFGPQAEVSLTEGSLEPIKANLAGRLESSVLKAFGLKFETRAPGYFFGQLNEKVLSFQYQAQAGEFYKVPFVQIRANGTVSPSEAHLSYFNVSGPVATVEGTLDYFFATKEASYTISGQMDPLGLPWFGPGWTQAFTPFGKIFPTVALSIIEAPNKPVIALGTASLSRHAYHRGQFDKTFASFEFTPTVARARFVTTVGNEFAKGTLSFSPSFSATLNGELLPTTLAEAYFDETPEVLENLKFTQAPKVEASLTQGQYRVNVQTKAPVRFYSLDFEGLDATVNGNKDETRIDPVTFGFAGGQGGMNATIDSLGVGYGALWVRNAQLGQWSLLGPLGEMLKFTTLKLDSLDSDFALSPTQVKIDNLSLWGNEHAVRAHGSINTQDKTLDLSVRLRTLGGSKPTLGLLAPIVQPFASVWETRLSGPLEKPVWRTSLASPFAN